MSRSYGTGIVFVFIAAAAWSTAGLFTRIVGTDIPTTLFWRSIFGGISVMLIFIAIRRPKDLAEVFRFTFGETVVAFISALGMMCFISAFFYTSIANVSFVYGAMPLITMLMAWAALRDPITPTAMAATTLSALGVAVLVRGGQDFSDLAGIGLALLMTLFMAGVTVAAKKFPAADAMKSAYLSGFMAALIMLPFSTAASVPMHDMIWLMLYGAVNVGLGFGVYLMGVSRVPALVAALIGLSEIPLAPVWAYLLFDERITAPVLLGGMLILSASLIYVVSSRGKG